MIAVDFETSFPQHSLTPPKVVGLFCLPVWREPVGRTRRKVVRLRKRYNSVRRHTLRLIRHLRRTDPPQVWRTYPDHVYAFILNGARRFSYNETSKR